MESFNSRFLINRLITIYKNVVKIFNDGIISSSIYKRFYELEI